MARVLYASFDEVPAFKGASTHILAYCRALEPAHDVDLMTLGAATLPAFGRFRHIPVAPREPNVLARGVLFRGFVRQRLERTRPEVLHVRTPWEGMAALDAGFRGAVVYEANGFPSLEWPIHHPAMTRRAIGILRRWEARCLERADRILCPSPLIANHILSRYTLRHHDKVRVIPNGYFPLRPDERPRSPASCPDEPLRLVYLGTLAPWQGLTWALRALRPFAGLFRLDVHAPPHRLYASRLRRRVRKLGHADAVRVMAPLDQTELTRVLSSHDVGLCPLLPDERNRDQGCCPLKLIEYLRAGLLSFAPDMPCVRQLLPDERTVELFVAGCLGSFRERFAGLIERRAALRAGPRPRLEDARLITWDEAGERLRSVYDELLSGSVLRSAGVSPV